MVTVYSANKNGTAMVMKFISNESICNHLAIAVHGQQDLQYSVTAVNVTVVRGESVPLRSDEIVNSKDAEMQFGEHIRQF